jgi:hypothetical protein
MLKSAPSRYLQLFCRTHYEWEMTHFPGFIPTDKKSIFNNNSKFVPIGLRVTEVFLHEQNDTDLHVGVIKHVVALRLRGMELTRRKIVKQASSLSSLRTHYKAALMPFCLCQVS